MSIPSSSALVDTTARTAPSRNPRSISRRRLRQVAAAITAHDICGPRRTMKCVLQVGGQDLDRQAALRKKNQLQVVPEKLERDTSRFREIRPSNPSCALTTGGLTNRKNFSPRGAPLFSTSSNGRPVSRSASSFGFAIVADEQMKTGSEP